MNIKFLSISMLCFLTNVTQGATVTVDNYTNQSYTIEITSSGMCVPTQVQIKPAQRNIIKDIGPTCSVKELRMLLTNPLIRYVETSDDPNKNFRISILNSRAMIVAGKGFVEKVFATNFDLNLFVSQQGYRNLSVEKDSGIILFKN